MENNEKDNNSNIVNIHSFLETQRQDKSSFLKKLLLIEMLSPFIEITRTSSKYVVLPIEGTDDEILCPKCKHSTWSDKRRCIWCDFDIYGYENNQKKVAKEVMSNIENQNMILKNRCKSIYIYLFVPVTSLLIYIFVDKRLNVISIIVSILFMGAAVFTSIRLINERRSLNRYIEDNRHFLNAQQKGSHN